MLSGEGQHHLASAAVAVCKGIECLLEILCLEHMLNAAGYDQAADVALGTAAQSAVVQNTITISYIWVETIGFFLCAVMVMFWNVEKKLPAEQAEIARRKGQNTSE